jgi:hypothetical protein
VLGSPPIFVITLTQKLFAVHQVQRGVDDEMKEGCMSEQVVVAMVAVERATTDEARQMAHDLLEMRAMMGTPTTPEGIRVLAQNWRMVADELDGIAKQEGGEGRR